jgi:hypothetical protein
MSAPFAPDPLSVATALLSFPKFGRFTTIWPPPKSSDAGRLSDDIIAAVSAAVDLLIEKSLGGEGSSFPSRKVEACYFFEINALKI